MNFNKNEWFYSLNGLISAIRFPHFAFFRYKNNSLFGVVLTLAPHNLTFFESIEIQNIMNNYKKDAFTAMLHVPFWHLLSKIFFIFNCTVQGQLLFITDLFTMDEVHSAMNWALTRVIRHDFLMKICPCAFVMIPFSFCGKIKNWIRLSISRMKLNGNMTTNHYSNLDITSPISTTAERYHHICRIFLYNNFEHWLSLYLAVYRMLQQLEA